MLTRLKFRKDIRVIARCLSDKNKDSDGKPQVITDAKKKTIKNDPATEKIQELLKSMMAPPKISEAEYREKFATSPDTRRSKQEDEIEVKTEKIEESITKAASDVAQAIGGDIKQTEAELLSRVLGKINQTSTTLSDLLVGMKVDRTVEPDDVQRKTDTRAEQVKNLVSKARTTEASPTRYSQRKSTNVPNDTTRLGRDSRRSGPLQITEIDIFSGEPLGIFKNTEPNYGTKLDVWDLLQQRELSLATAQPPANYFQKMIIWTNQGKVWKFPIDNEQGLEEEQKVHFSEHIFLDAHLEDWCPKKGPIRHFMELVCVGLSKNPFYTVQEKKETIMWYKEYFVTKKDLLSDVGAWDLPNSNKEVSV